MWGWGKKFLKGSGNSKSDEAPWAHLWSMTRGFRSQQGSGNILERVSNAKIQFQLLSTRAPLKEF